MNRMNRRCSQQLLLALIVALIATLAPSASAQTACLSENDIGQVPKTIRSDLYRGQQAFTVSMLEAIRKATPNENIFFSPYSTYHALLLAYFGAKNQTEQELIQALQLTWAKNKDHVARGYRLEKSSRLMRSKKMPLEFASADKIYFEKGVKLTECLSNVFVDELEEMDFLTKSEECRQNINNWIANVTHNEIRDMLNPGDVSPETQLVLANAAYFKGQWADQFDPKDTTQEAFWSSSSDQALVPMMHKRGTYSLAIDERLGAYVLQMPYVTSNDEEAQSEISMVIILPPFEADSLEKVLSKLSPESLDLALKESMAREIDISLPRFEFEQNLELVPILRQMGINSIFDHTADLSGFTNESKLMFGDAKHVAKIKVDEEGSTAAAATVLFSFRSARPVEPTKFDCNHPFLFLIYDHTSKAVLFTGIYRKPTQK